MASGPIHRLGLLGGVLLGLVLVAAGSGCLCFSGDAVGPPDAGADDEPRLGWDEASGDDGEEAGDEDDEAVDPGWPPIEETPLRPGVKIVTTQTPAGTDVNTCTANIVFSSPDNRTLYIGTASHCVEGLSVGDPVEIGYDVEGTLAYFSYGAIRNETTCRGLKQTVVEFKDFALVEIPDEARDEVHPALEHRGGPTEVGEPPDVGTRVLSYGNTPYRDGGQSEVDPAEAAQGVVGESTEHHAEAWFAPPLVFGDAGGPIVRADGTTVGVLTTVQLLVGDNGIVNLGPALDSVNENADLEVELKTWPRLPPVPAPLDEAATTNLVDVDADDA
jgi:hypothetical protein